MKDSAGFVLSHMPQSSLCYGPSSTNVPRTLWTLVTSSLGRGRVRMTAHLLVSKLTRIARMLSLPARKYIKGVE